MPEEEKNQKNPQGETPTNDLQNQPQKPSNEPEKVAAFQGMKGGMPKKPEDVGVDPTERIEELQKKLDSPHYEPGLTKRRRLRKEEFSVKEAWDSSQVDENGEIIPKPSRFGGFKMILILASLFFVGALVYSGFVFVSRSPISSDNIDFRIIHPITVTGGEKVSIEFQIGNRNNTTLEDVNVIVRYPEGARNPDNVEENIQVQRVFVGDVEPGQVVKRNTTAFLFGEETDVKRIDISMEYNTPGSSVVFQKDEYIDVAIGEPPVRLAINAVEEITSGQVLDIDFEISSNSNEELKNIFLEIDYPFGFIFQDSSMEAVENTDNRWFIESLKPGEVLDINVRGVIQGQNQEVRTFRIKQGIEVENGEDMIQTIFAQKNLPITISQPFLDFALSVNEVSGDEIVISAGREVNGTAVLTNTTGQTIENLQVQLTFQGEIIDKGTVLVEGGFYESQKNLITYNKQTNDRFERLDPDESVRFSFEFSPISFDQDGVSVQNPAVLIDAKIEAQRISEANVSEDISFGSLKKILFASNINLQTQSSHSTGPFNNTGPFPPKAEVPTTYSVTWSIYNSSNEIRDGVMRARLPLNVSWQNVVAPPGENLNFDPNTREVIWNIGNVAPGAGVSEIAKSVSFQVEIVPSVSQVGSEATLVENGTFVGYDTFAKTNITVNTEKITTKSIDADFDTKDVIE